MLVKRDVLRVTVPTTDFDLFSHKYSFSNYILSKHVCMVYSVVMSILFLLWTVKECL